MLAIVPNRDEKQMNQFQNMVRQFLLQNNKIFDYLIQMIHELAEDMFALKNKILGKKENYMSPYEFKQRIIAISLGKAGYTMSDIEDICTSGRANEILQEIEKLKKPDTAPPSRRMITHVNFK